MTFDAAVKRAGGEVAYYGPRQNLETTGTRVLLGDWHALLQEVVALRERVAALEGREDTTEDAGRLDPSLAPRIKRLLGAPQPPEE